MSEPGIFQTNENDFATDVIEASFRQPVLVDFWADWCPPCKALTPVLEALVRKMDGSIVLAEIEVDDNMHLAGRYKLRGFPTVLLIHRGEEIGRFSGFRPAGQVEEFIAGHLPDLAF